MPLGHICLHYAIQGQTFVPSLSETTIPKLSPVFPSLSSLSSVSEFVTFTLGHGPFGANIFFFFENLFSGILRQKVSFQVELLQGPKTAGSWEYGLLCVSFLLLLEESRC